MKLFTNTFSVCLAMAFLLTVMKKSVLNYMKTLLPLLLALFSVGVSHAGEPIHSSFGQPPVMARPQTWWHWVSGNVSKEGITADLEAMKQIGLGGVTLFNVDQSDVKGTVLVMDPAWRELVKHSLNEAARLDLQFSMQGCDGWGCSGGPWVSSEQSMQSVTCNDMQVKGGSTISRSTLPKGTITAGYYKDISTIALKCGVADFIPDAVTITTSPQIAKPVTGVPSSTAPIEFSATLGLPPFWIQYEFAQPITIGSVASALTYNSERGNYKGKFEASDDGVTFRTVCDLSGWVRVEDDAFPIVTAKVFRMTFERKKEPTGGWTPANLAANIVKVEKLKLGGARINNATARAGIQAKTNLGFDANTLPAFALTDVIDLTGQTSWTAPAGNWIVLRIGHTTTNKQIRPATKPGKECDKMSAAAVNSHIDNYFKPIWEDSPDKVGGTFKYIELDSWEAGCANWTPLMPEEFLKRRGYNLRPWLPTLTGRIIGSVEQTQRFLWDYRRTIADLVAENHYGVFQKRAKEKGMGLMSEAVGVGMPTVADQLQCKKYCDVPMGEFWFGRGTNMDDPKEAASAAHIYGQNIAACEAYTAFPDVSSWKNDPYSLKSLGDLAFCCGVNQFVFHRFTHQPWLDRKPGMCMGPWGINFERTNTWWNQSSAWMDYLTRCQTLLQKGRFSADLCYFYGEGAPVTLRLAELSPAVPAGYDYDVCSADALLNLLQTKNGRITTPSGMSYRVLVLPPLDRMTLPVLQKIAKLIREGAVVYGPKPISSPSLSAYPGVDQELAQLANEVWGDCDGKTVTQHAYGSGKVYWGEPLTQVLGVKQDFATSSTDLRFIHRKDADTDIYFVSNQAQAAITAECSFRVTGKIPELWYPDTDKRETVALYTSNDEFTTLPIPFDPSGSVFVVFRTPENLTPHPVSVVPVASLRTDEQNQIVLSTTQNGNYAIAFSDGSTKNISLQGVSAPLPLEGSWNLEFPPFNEGTGDTLKTTFDQLASWSDSANDAIKYFSGTATYKKTFSIPEGFLVQQRQFILDLGNVKNIAEVTLNGKPLGILWKAPFQLYVTGAVKEGENSLTIKVTNLWPNRLIGDQKLDVANRLTWTSVSLYKTTDPLLPSGLLGPVTIQSKAVVTVPFVNGQTPIPEIQASKKTFKVIRNGCGLCIDGLSTPELVEIYTITGMKVYSKVTGNRITVCLPKGVYVTKCKGDVVEILL